MADETNRVNAQNILVLTNAALAFIETSLPLIQQYAKTGDITAEEQKQVLDKYVSLKNRSEGQFQGPEWEIEASSGTPVPAPSAPS